MTTARERMARGYADSDASEWNRRAADEAAAKAWTWDTTAERLVTLMAAGHPVSPQQRSTAGYYTNAKRAAEAAGIDTGRPSS